uniref:Uncharacterized protein n=1 Tax=Aegilops tauschii subsp. strangulata TaxID=200361 RepID=A0A453PY18_AEGTS
SARHEIDIDYGVGQCYYHHHSRARSPSDHVRCPPLPH